MKKSVLLGMAAVCALTLSACGGGGGDASTHDSDSKASTKDSGKASGKQELRLVTVSEIPSADASLASDEISYGAINACYEGLYRVDKDQKLQPAGAAEMAEVSDDGLTYKFKLNKEATWSNGDKVTAKDYVYAWQRSDDPKTGSEYAYLMAAVKNAEAINKGDKPVSELGIKASGDYELEITLEKPTPYFESLLAYPLFFPQNQSVVEKYGDKYALTSENAVYNGPFTLADFDGPGSDTDWTYVKNDKYWDKKNVKLKKITMQVIKEVSTALNMYQDGQLDTTYLNGELAQQNANDPNYKVNVQGSTAFLEMNQIKDDSPFKNENLRKAISYSINRKALVNNILGNGSVEANGLVSKDLAFDKDGKDFTEQVDSKAKYNKDKAKEYWEKAKKELGVDSLEFGLLCDDSDGSKRLSEFLQGSIQDSLDGVKVNVSNVPFSVRLDRSNKGDFDMALSVWGADYADPSTFLDLFVTGNNYNRGKWSNEEYDKLNEAAATTDAMDPDKRWQDMLDQENLIIGEMGIIPVYQKAVAELWSPSVKGMVFHSSGVAKDYKWAYIDDSAK